MIVKQKKTLHHEDDQLELENHLLDLHILAFY